MTEHGHEYEWMGERVGYDLVGAENAPFLVLLGSLGTNRQVWDGQVPLFSNWFRVVSVEHPGHDGGRAPKGPYTVEMLGQRVLGLIDFLGLGRAAIAGLSLGGLVAMWLAVEHPERVERLAVAGSAPQFSPPAMWQARAEQVRAEGTAPLVEAALARWFTPGFVGSHPDVISRYRAMFLGVDPEGYASCCDALAEGDITGQLGRITAPTLVLTGAKDPVVPPASAAATMQAIEGSSLSVLAGAAHLANVEQPDAFNSAVLDHLVGRQDERGLATQAGRAGGRPRRAVPLGGDGAECALPGLPQPVAMGGRLGPARARPRDPPDADHRHARRTRASGGAGAAPAGGSPRRAQPDEAARGPVADGGVHRGAGGQLGLCSGQPGVGGGVGGGGGG